MSNPDMKAVNTEADPFNVVPAVSNGVKFEDGKLCGVLGKHSWNMIRLQK
jgi:alpha-N-arabinofuranosidase